MPTRLTKTNPKPEAGAIAAVATDHAVENIGKQRRDPNRSPSQAVGIWARAYVQKNAGPRMNPLCDSVIPRSARRLLSDTTRLLRHKYAKTAAMASQAETTNRTFVDEMAFSLEELPRSIDSTGGSESGMVAKLYAKRTHIVAQGRCAEAHPG